MIWSVSTSERSSTETGPLIFVTGSMSVPVPDVDEVALDRRGRGHLRRDEVSAPAAPLAALEVAVARGRAALAGRKRVRVHPEAHRAAGAAPVEPGGAEDLVEALLLGLGLHLLRPRPDPRIHAPPHPPAPAPAPPTAPTLPAPLRPSPAEAAARRSPMREFVHEPMKTRSSSICSIGVPGRRSM